MGNRRKTAANTPSISRGTSAAGEQPKQDVTKLSIPSITIDTFLNPMSHYIFLNIYTAPVFWVLIAPLLLIPFLPLATLCICWAVGALCVALSKTRSKNTVRVDWKNEIVVITGGSHGLGKELASKIASICKPRKIIVLDIMPTVHDSSLIAYYECDISDRRKIKSVAESIIHDYGHPTMLINNAGIVKGGSFLELSEAEIERTVSINLLGQIWTCKLFLPHMVEKNRGHILNIASVLGITGAKSMTDYCASKFGIVGFSESLRQDLSATNVQVSILYPGLINTGMFLGVDHDFPRLTPPLDPKYVSEKIISILDSGRGHDLKLPYYANFVTFLRFIPVEFADFLREIIGANRDMKKFRGSLRTTTAENI